jgi:hypothetical protein
MPDFAPVNCQHRDHRRLIATDNEEHAMIAPDLLHCQVAILNRRCNPVEASASVRSASSGPNWQKPIPGSTRPAC